MGNYPCRYPGCTKTYKSTSGRGYHEKHTHGGLYTQPDLTVQKQIAQKDGRKDLDKKLSDQITSQEEIKNIKICEVKFVMAKKKLNPKDEEFEYECAKCGAEFATRHKYCPECGVEFGEEA
jgi:predicted RNA-binding Zn-ribbon protein involved in translation (DUF1610 family)